MYNSYHSRAIMSIFAIILILTLVITTILFLWMKWKAKKSMNHIAQVVVLNNIQNRANINIGSDGRNINLLGTCGTSLFVSIFIVTMLMTLINYHSDAILEGIILVPVMSFICPSIFYWNNSQSFRIIKDILF